MAIRVDAEFRALIPPLSTEERSGLEGDIVRDGRATVPLIVWGDVLLDGHNRYDICTAGGLPYTTQAAPSWIKDRRDARIWIRTTALNRRNLGPITRAELASGNEEDIREKNAEAIAATQAKPGQGAALRNGVSPTAPKNFSEPLPGVDRADGPISRATRATEGHEGRHDREKIQAVWEAEEARKRAASRQTRSQAAASAGMSHPTYTAAKVVVAKATPELRAAADRGDIAVSTAAKIAELSPERQRAVVADGAKAAVAAAKEIRSAKLEERRQERVEKLVAIATGNRPLDTVAARYPIVYADPPWKYEHVETESRAIENQYPTMDLDAICKLDLASITTDDAVLFLWATSPKLAEAMRVVTEWGFTYRTCMVWDKEKIGMGYYARQQHELLLICTKGNPPTPPPAARPASVVREMRGEHSAKPDTFYTLIERMYPELPKVEMFCRKARAGWAVWGNQSRAA